jgi:hypothetical protein
MLTIAPIPAFDDNYIWLIFDQASLRSQGKPTGDTTADVFTTVRGWKDNF